MLSGRRWPAPATSTGSWEILTGSRWGQFDSQEIFQLLLKAIEVRARQSPEGYAQDLFARMVAFTSYLLLRGHFHMGLRIAQFGRSPQGMGEVGLPRRTSPSVRSRGS